MFSCAAICEDLPRQLSGAVLSFGAKHVGLLGAESLAIHLLSVNIGHECFQIDQRLFDVRRLIGVDARGEWFDAVEYDLQAAEDILNISQARDGNEVALRGSRAADENENSSMS